MSGTRNRLVVDLSHWNTVNDWKALAGAGVAGIIHKYSQGSGYKDPNFTAARQNAKANGLMFGRYHFADGTDVAAQVKNFLTDLQPDELIALDWEDNTTGGGTMTLAQAVVFMQLATDQTKQIPVLYSGNKAKEAIGKTPNTTISRSRLWLAQYGPRAVCPAGWDVPWLWQYTEQGVVAGIAGNADLNHFPGSRDELAASWTTNPAAPPAPAPEPAPPAPATDTVTISLTVPAGTPVTIHTTGDPANITTG